MDQLFPLAEDWLAAVIAKQGGPVRRDIGCVRFIVPVPYALTGGLHDQTPADFKAGPLFGKHKLVI